MSVWILLAIGFTIFALAMMLADWIMKPTRFGLLLLAGTAVVVCGSIQVPAWVVTFLLGISISVFIVIFRKEIE